MLPLYTVIAVSINIVATIAIFFGMSIGMWSLVNKICSLIKRITGIKPIIEISKIEKVGVLSEGTRIKLQELHNNPTDNVKQISTPKHKPSSTICSPGSKKGSRK